MDVVKICEVVDGCEDCPKYGDDCDGDKMTENTDLISRSALMEYCSNQKSKSIDNNDIARFPSADAVPTVIRAKTFMRKEDFDKWAEDIKRQGENVICIPCDAEVVSAVQGEWIDDKPALHSQFAKQYRCNKCGARRYKDNFCPNCGARMKGGAE